MKNAFSVFKREFKSYFDSPVAYVFLTAFLVLAGFLAFVVGFFYERGQAELTPFFFWHPWVYLLLVPAATMGLWADERRNGTAELILTLPVTALEVLLGKFLAAWAFIGVALALTFPVPATAGYLGSPDWGVVACGYIGSFLLAGAATAIGLFASTLSRSSVVGFVSSLAMVFALLVIGFDPVSGALAGWGVPVAIVDFISSLSLLSHFEALRRGVVDFADVGYYAGVVAFFIVAAKTVTDGRRGAPRGAAVLAAIAAIAVASCTILSKAAVRADFTQESLYTLSDGTKAVLKGLDKDVALKFYFSSSSPDMPKEIKKYSGEVEYLLGEYVRAAGGRIVLEQYDPSPDSDAEEWAQRYGVEPQAARQFTAPVYFGVVAACGDRTETLGALSPATESSLEYDITRLVTRVAWPERPAIGVMTSLSGVLPGGMDPMSMRMGQRPQQGWIVFSELSKDYDVRSVATDVSEIDADIKTLVVLHAKDLSNKTLYAIDQFVLRGGKLIACTDPMSIADIQSSSQGGMPMGMGGDGPSTLGALFDAWGIGFDTGKVACDLEASTKIGRQGADEPACLSLKSSNMNQGDLLVSRLTDILMPFAGSFTFDAAKAPDLKIEPLITTSKDHSSSVDKMALMMGGSAKDAAPDGEARVVAARLDGLFKTAFPQGPDGTNAVEGAVSEGRNSVMLFADSDFLMNDVCINILRTPFGSIPQVVNDNLSLFAGVIERYAGREELIGLRTRRSSNRPFDVVEKLRATATEKWQQKEAEFQAKLQSTQESLSRLQSEKSGDDRFILSSEQQEEIVKLRKAQADTRRELKNVRKELTADIDSLGTRLKWLNIALVPFLVVLFGLVRGVVRKRRQSNVK